MDKSVYIDSKHVSKIISENSMWTAVNNSTVYSHHYTISILIKIVKPYFINSNLSSVNTTRKHSNNNTYNRIKMFKTLWITHMQ